MRNKFAVVEKDGVESIKSQRNVANEGGGGCVLSQKEAKVASSVKVIAGIFVNNRLTIEDRKRNLLQILRAIGIYKEVTEGVNGVTQLMARIDAFLDPERIEEATTLAQWREKYKSSSLVP